ncbi:hypothetical protein MBLNU457_4860t2 [Dothideomycetes sp. NU457]
MGRIKKSADERHKPTISPFISDFIDKSLRVPLHRLPQLIATFPIGWPFPRGDVYHWIPLLNRFDHVFELFIKEYKLDQGPQRQPFETRLLLRGDAEEGRTITEEVNAGTLKESGYTQEGDRELIECILDFSRLLLESCANRSLYESSGHLNFLLNSVSLSLLKTTLRLALCLAQRYHSTKNRVVSSHVLNSLLASHYNLNLDRIQRLANVFPKKAVSAQTAAFTTPARSKDKSSDSGAAVNLADINSLVKSEDAMDGFRSEIADVQMTYYDKQALPDTAMKRTDFQPDSPASPTPVRRSSNLGPGSASRQDRTIMNEDQPETPSKVSKPDSVSATGPKVLSIAANEIASKPTWAILDAYMDELPSDCHDELLQRVRIASAFMHSKQDVEDIVCIRLLSIANLAYVYGEGQFNQKIAQPDSEEPRKLQIVQQLTDLLQPSSTQSAEVSQEMTIYALNALEALCKTKSKSGEVATALNISVSHGILFFVLRKLVSSLEANIHAEQEDQWREAVFTLVVALSQTNSHSRAGDQMVAAGLLPILVEMLQIRNDEAEKYYPNVLTFFDTFIHNGVRDAFQSLVNAQGLDVIANLTAQTVEASSQDAADGKGIPQQYQTKVIDYGLGFFRQQTLRILFKFIAHMFHHNTGAQDRLLRNLIDSPQLLGALKTVIENAKTFGSNVWTGAVNIVSSFIHSEPTSYNVIAEAGLSKGILDAVTLASADLGKKETSGPQGILPVSETMKDIPIAFGAICLNDQGLKMFQESTALATFLSVFTSLDHVKALEDDQESAGQIGQSFDELVRHHPPLKDQVSKAVIGMIQEVVRACQTRAQQQGIGVKLWYQGEPGVEFVAGGQKALRGVSTEELERAYSRGNDDIHSQTRDDVQDWMVDPPNTNPAITASALESDALTNGRTSGRSSSDVISVACKFLAGYFANTGMLNDFCAANGVELLVDLATCACNPWHFHELSTFDEMTRLFKQVAEVKPHLVLPSLLHRTRSAVFLLEPMMTQRGRERPYFEGFTSPKEGISSAVSEEILRNGTYTAKALVSTQVLCNILADVLTMPTFQAHRPAPNTFFSQINLTDVYIELNIQLGKLHSACIWEEILMQNAMPEEWKNKTKVHGMLYGNSEANKVMGEVSATSKPRHAHNQEDGNMDENSTSSDAPISGSEFDKRFSAAYKNTETLRYLLSQIPAGIASYYQSLGKSLLHKRGLAEGVSFYQQNATNVAGSMAAAVIMQLRWPTPPTTSEFHDRLAYDIVALSSTIQMFVDKKHNRSGGSSMDILTLVLEQFYLQDGLEVLNEHLQIYCGKLKEQSSAEGDKPANGLSSLLMAAIELILDFYMRIVQYKNIHEAQQSSWLSEHSYSGPTHPDYFEPSQFTVEIRHAVLPTVSVMWSDDGVMELLNPGCVKNVISILRWTLEADGEHKAMKAAKNEHRRMYTELLRYKPTARNVDALATADTPRDLAIEALFRCRDNMSSAKDYCSVRRDHGAPRLPPPIQAVLPMEEPSSIPSRQAPASSDIQPAELTRSHSVEMRDADASEPQAPDTDELMTNDEAGADDSGAGRRPLPIDLLNGMFNGQQAELMNLLNSVTGGLSQSAARRSDGPRQEIETEKFITVEDLNKERREVREGLIERCLVVLSGHTDVTFDLADLITAAVSKQKDGPKLKAEIGENLVMSLFSLRPDEDSLPEGKKIASYAHLLAIILQERDFFDAAVPSLKENFELFSDYLKVPSSVKFEDCASYISNILLIIERVLAEDEQPQSVEWKQPSADQPLQEQPPMKLRDPITPLEDKQTVFDSILQMLPRVGKDETLALSLVRTLVILSRQRPIAKRLSEKQNLGRLFLMVKQLAGITNERLQSALLIVLRHIIEDDETVRQIMRTEIQAAFENNRRGAQIDTTAYARNLYHLVLRNPEIFVEITNEKVQLVRWDSHQRPQPLKLKTPDTKVDDKDANQAAEVPKAEGAATSVEKPEQATPRPGVERTKTSELKAPTVENPDGVIQFLLKELSSYRDVEDKDSPAPSQPAASEQSPDVAMADSTPTPGAEQSAFGSTVAAEPKVEKAVFQSANHPIYIYRCFLLQCLVELLASYNRTKVEFINFSPKLDAATFTPSKPRSGLLNYLLTSLIPVGTLDHKDDMAHKKKLATSNWAISVIVALCAKTSEHIGTTDQALFRTVEEEPDLVYVRKFVLEQISKVYKDAMSSNEALDQKYSRLLALADLLSRMLTNKQPSGPNIFNSDSVVSSQRQLGRLMYEKNFVTTLTSSLADIDLNFPNAKRAVKYILRPLKWLTNIAVEVSTSSDSSLPGTTDEDEISSATSISEDDDEREETPDLFRNSTLGQFEPGREDDDESDEDEDDDEMDYYGDEYDEEMEYEDDGHDHDHGDVVSDEDEELGDMGEIEGMPGDVDMNHLEIVMDDAGADSDDDDEDDEDDDDEDDDDDDEEIEIIDEITGDDENASGEEGDDDEADWEDEVDHYDEGYNFGSPHGGPLEQMARVLDEESETIDVHGDLVHGDHFRRDYDLVDDMHEEEDEEDEEDEEGYDEDEIVYEPEIEPDEDDEEMGWGFDDPGSGMLRGQMAGRIPPDPWAQFDREMRLGGTYRTHRGAGVTGRATDDGTNPLLQRGDVDLEDLRMGRGFGGWGFGRPGEGTPSIISGIMNSIAAQGGAPRLEVSLGEGGPFPGGFSPIIISSDHPGGHPFIRHGPHAVLEGGSISTLLRQLRDGGDPSRSHRTLTDPTQAVAFTPTLSVQRWQDEARILFGNGYVERSLKVVNAILRLLTPHAMEAKRLRDKEEQERAAAAEKARAEQRQKEEAEKKEQEEKEKKEREEREAKEAEEAAQRAQEVAEIGDAEAATEMEGVEESQTVSEPAPAAATEPVQRVMTSIRGREIDITNLGIDADYLEALPEEMREEVIMAQVAEQRTQAHQSGQAPTEISPEFLEALPPDIAQELLRQEAQDRRRREREQQRRQNAAAGNAPAQQPEEMNNADFMAMLDPALRQSVLMEADDNMLAALPAEFQAEARALLGARVRPPGAIAARLNADRTAQAHDRADRPPAAPVKQRRPVGQILDKSGVATLLRLMFVSLHGSARQTMQNILSDICKNAQNRAEVISVLLSILQDGSLSGGALEKSYTQLTVRAKTPGGPKTPQPVKRTPTGSISLPTTDISPLMIVQQCLSTLTSLANENPRVSSFFLSEHETLASQRAKSTKKGKGKETKATRYPLNALLTLLDRKSIIENSACMEALAGLLVRVSEPLKILLRKAKEAEKEKEKEEEAERAAQRASAAYEAGSSTDVAMAEAAPTEPANATVATEATPNAAADASKPEESTAEPGKKKERELTPPEVPEENLCLVVNIIAARECIGKTFRATIDLINHLSAIPGARNTFGKELVRRAQDLGAEVLSDLEQLPGQIRNAETSTDVQGMALASFSPASSHQNKLLRVLVALDYIFDPKRSHDGQAALSADHLPQKTKDDLVSTLYENQTFVKLWNVLSDSLTAIRERDTMGNVATILQPLIESFMVVCKNITVKDTDKENAMVMSQDLAVGTPPPEGRIEKLFFRFTDEHRKILNDLVRHNPRLMSGTFDVLVKNSKVLEFDNKRNFFNKRLHARSAEDRVPHPTLQLNIRRSDVFLDSFKSLYYKKPNEIKYGKLNIRFHGEEGVDAGGVTREWFGALSRQMFNPDYALFNPVAADRTTFHPNPLSVINEQHLTFFRFIGRIIGKALYEGRVLDCHFSRAVYKRILGKPVSLKDMETLDLDYYKSLVWILENDITDVTFETFSVEVDKFGVTETVDLIPGGRDIPVTEENKREYVNKVVEQRLTKSVEEQLEHFLMGFQEIVPTELITIFNEQELELLISGLPDIDTDDWKNNTDYHNYTQTSPQVQWFWRAVRSFDKEEKAKLLQFVTGTSKVPLNGFKELEGMNGFTKFNIHRDFSSVERLPSSHTCFNQLDLPAYDTYEQLRKQLYTAMTQGNEYFGFA